MGGTLFSCTSGGLSSDGFISAPSHRTAAHRIGTSWPPPPFLLLFGMLILLVILHTHVLPFCSILALFWRQLGSLLAGFGGHLASKMPSEGRLLDECGLKANLLQIFLLAGCPQHHKMCSKHNSHYVFCIFSFWHFLSLCDLQWLTFVTFFILFCCLSVSIFQHFRFQNACPNQRPI